MPTYFTLVGFFSLFCPVSRNMLTLYRQLREVVNWQSEVFLKNNLRDLRKAAGLSQDELGKRVGIAHNSVSGYENGKTPLTPPMIEIFAKALNLSADRIKVFDEMSMGEDAVPYRVKEFPWHVVSDELLRQLVEHCSKKIVSAGSGEIQELLDAMNVIAAELKRRAEKTERTKP